MSRIVVASAHRPFQRLTGNTYAVDAAEHSRFLHVHVVSIQARWTVRNQHVEINKIMGRHLFSSFGGCEFCEVVVFDKLSL